MLASVGTNPKFDTLTLFTAHTDDPALRRCVWRPWPHPSMVKGGPGRAGNGNFALSDFQGGGIAPKSAPSKVGGQAEAAATRVPLSSSAACRCGPPSTGDPKSAWAVDPQFGKDHAAVFDLEKPVGHAGGSVLTFTLAFPEQRRPQPRPTAVVADVRSAARWLSTQPVNPRGRTASVCVTLSVARGANCRSQLGATAALDATARSRVATAQPGRVGGPFGQAAEAGVRSRR